MEIASDGTTVTAAGVTPGDDEAVVFQRREGAVSGEDPTDTGLELAGDAAARTERRRSLPPLFPRDNFR